MFRGNEHGTDNFDGEVKVTKAFGSFVVSSSMLLASANLFLITNRSSEVIPHPVAERPKPCRRKKRIYWSGLHLLSRETGEPANIFLHCRPGWTVHSLAFLFSVASFPVSSRDMRGSPVTMDTKASPQP